MMKRREFLVRVSVSAAVLPMSSWLAGCGNSSGADPNGSTGNNGGPGDPRSGGDSAGVSGADGFSAGSGGDSAVSADSPSPADGGASTGADFGSFADLTVGNGVAIVGNHLPPATHSVTVPGSDLSTQTASKLYSLMGIHLHNFTLTGADFDTLRAGGLVTKTTSVTGLHSHVITLQQI